MTATAWLFVATVLAIVLAGIVLERWQRNLDEREERRYEDGSHRRLLREIDKQP